MTNTLHRLGDSESFRDDFIVFAIPSKSNKDPNALPKLHRFMEIAMEYKPVNLGETRHGGALRSSKNLSPLSHWKRDMKPDFKAVFDNLPAAEQFVKRIKEEDLGMSINISTSIEGAESCCNYACIDRHSVGYSLGFEGKTEKIPNSQVATLSTMCGHGMISHSLAKKMIDFVKENRRSPEQAATYLSRFCSCGIFNPSRAKRILEDARTNSK
jgi:hypothetical protein